MTTESKQTGVSILKDQMPNFAALIRLSGAKGDPDVMARQELAYLESSALANPKIWQCEKLSIVLGIKWVLKNNLTLDNNAGLVYVQTRNVNVGGSWKQVLEVKPSPEGLISIARQCGRILDIKNPIVKKDAHGKVIEVEFDILLPAYGSPRWEKRSFDESNFERWRRASHKQNSRGWKDGDNRPKPNEETLNCSNPLYTSWKGGMDPEFAKAKAIRHGLKKLGINQNETSIISAPPLEIKKLDINPKVAQIEAMDEVPEYVVSEEVKPTEQVKEQVIIQIPNTDEL